MEQTPRQGPPEKDDFENFWLPEQPASTTLPGGPFPENPPVGPVDRRIPYGVSPQEWQRLERRRRLIAIGLFIATCLSVYDAGRRAGMFQPDFYQRWNMWVTEETVRQDIWKPLLFNGLMYAIPLMAILIAHEGGHWLLARIHGVPATVPFFIPFPFYSPIGTMGAVILQDGRRADRRALFDIAVAGPLAGLLVAIPVAWMGVQLSVWKELPKTADVISYGDPLILKWMVHRMHPDMSERADVMLNPLLFAGWVGIFITALNLMPIGQLDGGHILYTLIGTRAHKVSMLLLGGGVALMIWFQSPAYALMAMLLFLTGARHPPTANDRVPIGAARMILGWLTLAFIIVGFTPTPITTYSDPPKQEQREPAEQFETAAVRALPPGR